MCKKNVINLSIDNWLRLKVQLIEPNSNIDVFELNQVKYLNFNSTH